MDNEKAKKAAELVSKRTFISTMIKEYNCGKLLEDATITVHIYARWIPAIIDIAMADLVDIDKQIQEL